MNRSQRRHARAKTGWMPLRQVQLKLRSPEQIEAAIAASMRMAPHLSEEVVRDVVTGVQDEIVSSWANDKYQAHVIPWPAVKVNGIARRVVQLSIRRIDRLPARDWRDLQRIKTQLLGPEVEAVELYPAESRVVDTANQFHLWAVADPLFRFPFGWDSGRVTSNDTGENMNAKQRPLEEVDAMAPGMTASIGAMLLPIAPLKFDPLEFARYVKELGLAFHPDTGGHEYMNGEGEPFFTPAGAEAYDEVMAAARDAAAAGEVPDPYEMGMEIWRQEGLIEGERWGR